jgi:molybdopterin molybdotransferase
MTAYEDALSALLEAIRPLPSAEIPLTQAVGRYLSAQAVSRIDLPPFDNSAMDGYAVRASDTLSPGVSLRIRGEIPAGTASAIPVLPGECLRIFTGAPLPPGADSVVMQEDTRPDGTGGIQLLEPVRPWENVRFRGEDVRSGASLLPVGTRVGPPQLALLLAAGLDRIQVHRQPSVAIASTGDELVPPGQSLGVGQIHDTNAASLAALLSGEGAQTRILPVIRDDLGSAARALEEALSRSDMVVTAGGASVGERDVIRAAFEKIGGRIQFWRIAIRPGKPFFFGQLDGRYLLGLPGNPVSALVTAVLLVLPALRRIQGSLDPAPRSFPAILAEPLSNSGGRRHFVRVTLSREGLVRRSGIQASHLLSSLALADGLADVPAGVELPAGASIRFLPW